MNAAVLKSPSLAASYLIRYVIALIDTRRPSIRSEAELVAGLGCIELGDPTNGLRYIKRAQNDRRQ